VRLESHLFVDRASRIEDLPFLEEREANPQYFSGENAERGGVVDAAGPVAQVKAWKGSWAKAPKAAR